MAGSQDRDQLVGLRGAQATLGVSSLPLGPSAGRIRYLLVTQRLKLPREKDQDAVPDATSPHSNPRLDAHCSLQNRKPAPGCGFFMSTNTPKTFKSSEEVGLLHVSLVLLGSVFLYEKLARRSGPTGVLPCKDWSHAPDLVVES